MQKLELRALIEKSINEEDHIADAIIKELPSTKVTYVRIRDCI